MIIKHKCPFCGELFEWSEHCNVFCRCGCKYYSEDKCWLNRKTGEIKDIIQETGGEG